MALKDFHFSSSLIPHPECFVMTTRDNELVIARDGH
eukprot:CAMPEP_0202426702 /NCGR_PEP_ID=MMETSP1345-20130828/1035_1 /ASSEMBLY_ACC=CAM_ASM_000843 /TAXON_ID=342563 /ORGANISM="Fabrea Fabrea salina" /LENGTH=35 /DNA_ID= /DNA_START= /DNA_END= /DNA_ORIENTATION=